MLLPGCILWNGPADHEPSSQHFAAYAEAVFRRQNHATSQMMLLSLEELEDKQVFEKLLGAEKSMQRACEALNAYAEQNQNGLSSNLLLRARAGKSVIACDEATKILENLLEDLDLAAVSVEDKALHKPEQ